MTNESIRIRTTPGVDKNIRVKLDQDFDFLEVLSLKISQEELYRPFCADYGVVVGRVIANRGFGVPNAKVSIFIPITDEDQRNELIKDLYPFKTPYQKNKQGIRYNLLLSKSTCELNKPIGTFPTKEEVLDNDIILEVFDKYYKYTTKTNEAGDYMIFGVPVGQHTIHMDVDISDIGAASVRPYDLISEGFPEKLFESKTEFKSSTNLDSLPQVNSGNKGINVIPFWGDSETCEIGITRSDFNTSLNIKPTALFFGSIFTDSGKMALNRGCNPRNDMGEQDSLRTASGRIEMIRANDYNLKDWVDTGKIVPIELEEFSIEGGDLIDDDGNFAFAVPMNLGHVITDEYGNLIPSNDPSVGLPTKGMYRFKMNFNEAPENPKLRTAHMIFPSLGRDFGGSRGYVGGAGVPGTEDQRFTDDITQYNSSELTKEFHLFEWKQVYTIAHYIKKYKKGNNRFSFIGIKNTDISAETNPFPFTTAIWKFDILYYILSYFIEYFSFLLKLFIILVSFCFGFCFNIRIAWDSGDKGFLGKLIKFDLHIISLCFSVCPFKWLANIFPTLPSGSGKGFFLPCEGGGPDGADGYEIDLLNCNTSTGFCGEQSGVVRGVCCGKGSEAPNCSPDSTNFNYGSSGTDTDTNACLKTLESWKCCVKLNLAENRNVIRRVFNDAWILGSAYLFQFKYRKKIKKSGDKEKFCGPGSDIVRGDNYKSNKCCPETEGNCDSCLLRGPNLTRGGVYSGVKSYHEIYHNASVTLEKNGATDIGDIIYCNALMSTKIVSLGRIEMCEETLEQIQNSIYANRALHQYIQSSPYYTGTFSETGWDTSIWSRFFNETSYQDPRDVLTYLAKKTNPACQLNKMFYEGSLLGSAGSCHEYELKDSEFFFMKEVSKIYTDVVTSIDTVTKEDVFNPINETFPFADSNALDLQDADGSSANGGFEVLASVANRFSPCGNLGSCYPGSNWLPTLGGDNDDLSYQPSGFDRFISPSNRNNQNTRSNIPYYYFGIRPGKTAINKLRDQFFIEK